MQKAQKAQKKPLPPSPSKGITQQKKAQAIQQYQTAVKDHVGYAKKFALQHSPYLATLLDPWNVTGQKIPDDNTAPSFTFQTISKIALGATNAGTNTGVGVFYQLGPNGPNQIQQWSATAVANQYTASNIAASTPWYTQLAANAMMARPVSCGLCVSSSGSTTLDAGRMYLAFLPPGEAVISPPAIALGNLGNAPTAFRQAAFAVDVPMAKRFARVIWLPIDAISRTYMVPGASMSSGVPRPPSGTSTYGALSALCDGIDASAQLEFTLVVNWEAIPISSLTNILQATPSASDPLELAAVSNVISSHPTIAQIQVPAETVAGTQSTGMAVKPAYSGPSFLDKVMSGIGKAVQVGKVVAPAISSALALL